MSSTTTNLNLYKANPTTDGENTFNIDTLLNENWDKIDAGVAKKSEIPTIPTSLPANGGNSTTVNNHTAAATPTTTEQIDLIGMVNEVNSNLTSHKADNVQQFNTINIKLSDYNSYASSVDSNGIYTVIDYKRADGTLYMKSTLSGGTSPSYTTDTWQFYDALGTTLLATKTWTITYDVNGKITSKVVA